MKKSMNNIFETTSMRQYRLHLILLILVLPFVLMGCMVLAESESDIRQEEAFDGSPISILTENDPTIRLLGKSFIEITQFLGVPDEKGYSEMFGPHQYILYKYDEGFIRFCSPESLDHEIAISIILGPGQEILGTTIGMRFSEISDILGAPDFGPDIGMDDIYYMDYYYGELNGQMPEIFVSFVAVAMDAPTDYVFIKLENYTFEGMLLQVALAADS